MVSTQIIEVNTAVTTQLTDNARTRLGRRLHPVQITDAWYAQDCPPRLDTTSISLRVRLQWRLACWLRGIET